ncbi:hypothetical protein DFH27DRAFT_611549 [Peziza echinospora]|nr:hypothetical protein DFH27DRAFT_611549 [Peziza echinospora]
MRQQRVAGNYAGSLLVGRPAAAAAVAVREQRQQQQEQRGNRKRMPGQLRDCLPVPGCCPPACLTERVAYGQRTLVLWVKCGMCGYGI